MIKVLTLLYQKRLWLSLIPLLIIPISAMLIYKKDKVIFPMGREKRKIETYTDSSFQRGVSKINHCFVTDDSVDVAYTLIDSNRALLPFAGISFMDSALANTFNPFDYDHITLDFESDERQQGYVILAFYIDGLSNREDKNPYMIFKQVPFSVFPNRKNYTLDLNNFYFPDWWLQRSNQTIYEVQEKRLHKLWHIFVDMNSNNKYINSNQVKIKGLRFHKSYKEEFFVGLVLLVFYYLLLFSLIAIVKQHEQLLSQRRKIELPYKTIEIIDTKLQDLKMVIDFIQKSYASDTLTINEVCTETGLTVERINSLLQDHFNGANFKQYLNIVRIDESKRLLRESSLKVSDISSSVGYANITHFNRMFKRFENCTPTHFREFGS